MCHLLRPSSPFLLASPCLSFPFERPHFYAYLTYDFLRLRLSPWFINRLFSCDFVCRLRMINTISSCDFVCRHGLLIVYFLATSFVAFGWLILWISCDGFVAIACQILNVCDAHPLSPFSLHWWIELRFFTSFTWFFIFDIKKIRWLDISHCLSFWHNCNEFIFL